MRIREMGREECLRVLARATLARLACAHENQPYVVPVSLAYHGASGYLYGFTTPGQKVEWMRANPRVCVEVDEFSAYDQWVSVVVQGRYEELPEVPVADEGRLRARKRPRQLDDAMPAWSADSGHRLRDDDGRDDERLRAWRVLETHPMWWEPGSTAWAARSHPRARLFVPVYYRISIDHVSGHEAAPDARDSISRAVREPAAQTWSWLRRTLARASIRAPR